jgi:hypothetical protein
VTSSNIATLDDNSEQQSVVAVVVVAIVVAVVVTLVDASVGVVFVVLLTMSLCK